MSQSNNKSKKIFYILLILFVLFSLFATYISIYFTNKNKDKSEEPLDNPSNEVISSDTLTVYKKYPINPLNYTYLKENSSIIIKVDGLKNKDIENKINERISQNKNCRLQASFSNIISMTCEEENINIDLTTGNDIKLEEIFQKDTNIDNNLINGMYDNINNNSEFIYELMYFHDKNYSDIYPEFDEFRKHFFELDSFILKEVEQFKKSFFIAWDSLGYISSLDLYDKNFSYKNFYTSIAIYDRFLTEENIYENEVEKYFYPLATNMYLLDSYDNYYADFVNEKTFLDYHAYFDYIKLNSVEQKKINDKLFDYIINNLEKNTKFQYNYYYLIIEKTANNEDLYPVIIQYYTMNLDKSSFEEFISSTTGHIKAYDNIKTKINLFIDKNGNISEKDDDPNAYFDEFEAKLYNYFINGMNEYCEINKWNSECYFRENLSKLEDLTKESNQFSFAIDEDNEILYVYYYNPYDSFNLQIPFNILNETNNDANETIENVTQ